MDIVGPDATTQQEGGMSMIVVEDAPVKLFSIAAYGLSLCVEEEIVGNVFVLTCPLEVSRGGTVEGLYDGG